MADVALRGGMVDLSEDEVGGEGDVASGGGEGGGGGDVEGWLLCCTCRFGS